MPELPEVETIRSQLASALAGLTFTAVDKVEPAMLRDCTAEDVRLGLPGGRIESVDRLGKFLTIRLANSAAAAGEAFLTLHLGMTGQLLIDPGLPSGPLKSGVSPPGRDGHAQDKDAKSVNSSAIGATEDEVLGRPARSGGRDSASQRPHGPHTRFVFRLENEAGTQTTLEFRDIRKFGRLHLTSETPAPRLSLLGPDAWRGDWGADYLEKKLRNRTAPLKAFLLDQRHLAGIGNIYADEILWWSELSPLRESGSVGGAGIERLACEIRRTLGEGVRLLGCSFSDFVDTAGKQGSFQDWLRAYGKQGQPCARCGSILVRVIVAGRGTAFCPGCQK